MSQDLLRIKERHERDLLEIPGVVGVGVGQSINVYVEEYTPQIATLIPEELDGEKTVIIETGKIILLPVMQPIPVATAIYTERTGRFRPVPGGVSIGAPQITAGTLGCQAVDKKSRDLLLGLSNAHVCYTPWGELEGAGKGNPILQPGPADGGTLNDQIGTVDRYIPVKLDEPNLVDAAAFTSKILKKEILEIGEPDRLADPYPGMNIVKSGRSSGVTYSRIIDCSATVKVEGWGTCIFRDQVVCQPACMIPGDSGSLWLEQDTFRVVALGFAGSPVVSVACKARHVEELLGIEIVPPVGYVPWYVMLGVWSGVAGISQAAISAFSRRREGVLV